MDQRTPPRGNDAGAPVRTVTASRRAAAEASRRRTRRERRFKLGGLAALGAALVGTALAVRQRARRAECEHPPIGGFVEVDGVRVHVAEWGRGRPVVLIHGNGTLVQDWEISGLAPELAKRYRVIAIDRPGYGYTERPRDRLWTARAQADLVLKVLRRLGIERPIVLGHSWGAIVAAALGLDHGRHLSGLVLLGGYYFPTPRADALIFAPPALPVIGDAMRYTISPVIGALLTPPFVRRVFEPRPVPRRFEEEFPTALTLRPVQLKGSSEDTALMIPSVAAMRHRYGELGRLPVAIFAGAEDRIVTAEHHSARLHDLVPGSTFRRLPGLGHMIHYDAVGEIAGAVDRVWREAEDSPATSARRAEHVPIADKAGFKAEPMLSSMG